MRTVREMHAERRGNEATIQGDSLVGTAVHHLGIFVS